MASRAGTADRSEAAPWNSRTAARNRVAAWRAYEAQQLPARRLFGLLRVLPGEDHATAAIAAAMALGLAETESLLACLATADLIERADARTRVSVVGTAVRPAWAGAESRAIQRWYDWLLAHVRAAADLLYPQVLRLDAEPATAIPEAAFGTPVYAATWLETEIGTLRRAINAAASLGLPRYAWQLADALRGYSWQEPRAMSWVGAATDAVEAARDAGTPREVAAAYLCLADAYFHVGDLDRAERACVALGANASRAGWLSGAAAGHANRGGICQRRGRRMDALHQYGLALELYGAAGRLIGEAGVCNNIGAVYLAIGDGRQALTYHRRALMIFRRLGSLTGEARTRQFIAAAASASRVEARAG